MTRRLAMASSVLAMTGCIACCSSVDAVPQAPIFYDLPAQALASSLRAIGRASKRQIFVASNAVEGRMAKPLRGSYVPDDAVAALLSGSGIRVRFTDDAILVGDDGGTRRDPAVDGRDNEITVTGTRVKGAPSASPKMTVTSADIAHGGFTDLGDALRALPQNFSGGQNPGVGAGASAGGITNQNITGGSSVNLRGLGQDATLTLLNGNRLAFGGFSQGVDISGIPLAAVDQVDVVADGASAIYGSDAVGGVVNVVLKPKFEGLTVDSQVGTATDGGDFSQRYSLVAGTHWQTGNVLAAYSYRQNEAINADQRDYTKSLGSPYMLLPPQHVHSAIVSLKQALGSNVTISDDSMFSFRGFTRLQNAYGEISSSSTTDKVFSTAPSLKIDFGSDWSLKSTGVYSTDTAKLRQMGTAGGVVLFSAAACYCSRLASGEAYVEGPVAHLPAGAIRLVAGGGYRATRFEQRNLDTGASTGGSQRNAFAYAELFIPILSPSSASDLGYALSLTGAGRFDHYNGFGGIGTPKVGLIYSPTRSLDLKFSWGQSFKAPTLMQQFQSRTAYLFAASSFVGSTALPDQTALYTDGSARLRPERADTASWTIAFHPARISGFNAELSYYRITYRDRVLQPIGNYTNSLASQYSQFVVANPTATQVAAAIADTDVPLQNFAGIAFDPSQVAYIIDNHYLNVARQRIQGVDLSLSYRIPFDKGAVLLTANGSWLDSRQKNGAGTPYFDLSGTIWNPPTLRFRSGAGWDGDRLKAFAYVNYIGGVQDQRSQPVRNGASMITADLTISYSFKASDRLLNGLTISASVENLFDRSPPYLEPAPYTEPYDSTNYSAVGRFASISLSQTF